MTEKKEFELEDILAEQRRQREGREDEAFPADLAEELPVQGGPEEAERPEAPAPAPEEPRRAPAREADQQSLLPPDPPGNGKKEKKKKKRKGLFGRKRVPEFDEGEDMYYGVQLKPIDEYRKGFDPATGEFSLGADAYSDLFDDSKKAIDDEVEQNFLQLQRERRRRVAEAVQTAGVDEEQIADEFGVVAPMPVTAFAADPYARQHGIQAQGTGLSEEEVPEFQRAMMETVGDQSMEIKLNVANDTVEIQRVRETPTVSEESINRILESIERESAARAAEGAVPEEEFPEEPLPVEQSFVQEAAPAEMEFEDYVPEEAPAAEEAPEQEEAPAEELPEPVITGRPLGEIPQVASVYEYRSRNIPTHVINADVLQSALLSESEILRGSSAGEEEARRPSRRRVRPRMVEEPEEEPGSVADITESIDDYTGPEDAKSISHELRGDMSELTLRLTITGVCTVLLAGVNLIFGSRFSGGAAAAGTLPLIYVVLTLVFLGVAVGVCYRTVINGLKALFAFNANSDSAAAVAAVAVGVQTVAAMFFRSELADGKLHLYAVVLSAILFINAAGKLTMIRRIHSNFRFVTSREQKYAVRTFEDYNTSLKMTKDCVAEKPLIAYQCKAGFLKRFLELSYDPDPSESTSQLMVPIGLVSSLVLCIACLLITRSVPTALSALAAACCACVAVSNMLAVNLPVSRLCKTARRGGAMIVGYHAVEQLGNVNAVLVDAGELFPGGTVVLGGIKTFGNRAGAEEAIIAASALMKEIGGPLSGVFDQVISENEDALPQVESFTYEEGGGIIGRVDDRTIYIGVRPLLVNHRIELPAREEENQYAAGNKSVVYIAVDTTVAAMLVLSYNADRRRKNELQRLENSGVSVVIRTTDPNVTPQLVSRLFGVDTANVGVLEGELGDLAMGLMEDTIPRADASVATKGRMESMMTVVADCVAEKRTAGLVVAIQTAAVILGFVLVAFMACFGGMRQLSSFVLFAFQVFWLLLVIVIPKLRK